MLQRGLNPERDRGCLEDKSILIFSTWGCILDNGAAAREQQSELRDKRGQRQWLRAWHPGNLCSLSCTPVAYYSAFGLPSHSLLKDETEG